MIVNNHYIVDIATAGRIERFYEAGALESVIMAETAET